MNNKLCCVLNPEVKCKECQETWCYTDWFDREEDTSHTNKLVAGGWGKCPKTGKKMRWSSEAWPEDGGLQYIEARANDT